MQYRVQFIDGSDKVVREMQADAGSAANAFLLVADNDWPPNAVRVSTGTGASLPCPSPQPHLLGRDPASGLRRLQVGQGQPVR